MTAPTITEDTKFLAYTLVTDTLVYEIVGRTAKTLKVRRCADGESHTDERCDKGAHGLPVVQIEQLPNPSAPVKTVRLRQDGTYRLADWSALRPAPMREGVPVRRVDYRF